MVIEKTTAPPGKRPPKSVYLPVVLTKYGYPPPRFVVIHHLNENPNDQRPENLVYLPRHIHYKLHMWERQGSLTKYATEIILTIQAFVDKRCNGNYQDTSSIASNPKDTRSDIKNE